MRITQNNTSSLDIYLVQEILKSFFNVDISKASILLRDLTLSDQVSAPYNRIDHM